MNIVKLITTIWSKIVLNIQLEWIEYSIRVVVQRIQNEIKKPQHSIAYENKKRNRNRVRHSL